MKYLLVLHFSVFMMIIDTIDIIFTAYFATHPNPQGRNWRKNNIIFIQPLYDSVKRLRLDMVVFHDHLKDKFIKKYTTDKIRFVKHKPKHTIPTMGRFYCYLEHLRTNIYNKILCLDCGDLELYKDPFPLIGDSILIGSEEGKIGDSIWMKDVFYKAYEKTYYGDRQVLNCGILGGKYHQMCSLLSDFKIHSFHKGSNVDMAVFNKLIYDFHEFITGYPIHTVFGKFEENTDCYIRHK